MLAGWRSDETISGIDDVTASQRRYGCAKPRPEQAHSASLRAVSAKYPRTLHLPWSPGGTSDDKRLSDVSALIGVEIVVTEKCDGSNLTYTRKSVFSRSHTGPPGHASFNVAKATHARIAHAIPEGVSVFCEYCYAVHSISYESLPSYSLVFGVREDVRGSHWDWEMVSAQAADLGLPTVPVLFRGQVGSPQGLRALTEKLCRDPSTFGGSREGIVVRVAASFSEAKFGEYVAKCVRRDHVQTDEHWLHQPIVPQKLA